MIPIPGRLTVREITGRKGKFVVGDLVTEVGNFKVKDTILDQFEPGVYTGIFMVLNIYPDSYIWQGRVTTEIRAKVHEIHLDHEDKDLPAGPEQPAEPDPAEQVHTGTTSVSPALPVAMPSAASAPTQLAPPPAPTQPTDDAAPHGREGGDVNPDLDLFGAELYEAVQSGISIKLDPTIDRTKFRAQRDRLKALGYAFVAGTQSWLKQAASE